MIQKVSLYFILPMMIIAFFLSLLGVTHIGFGNDYYNFLSSATKRIGEWNFQIPDIPKINKINESSYDSSGLILQVLIKIANFFVSFVNIITRILNVLIVVINVIIQMLEFIISCIIEVRNFINKFRSGVRLFAYV